MPEEEQKEKLKNVPALLSKIQKRIRVEVLSQ